MVGAYCKTHGCFYHVCGRDLYIKKGCSYCKNTVACEEQGLAKFAARRLRSILVCHIFCGNIFHYFRLKKDA